MLLPSLWLLEKKFRSKNQEARRIEDMLESCEKTEDLRAPKESPSAEATGTPSD
jgi:hypothetical protein